MAVPFQVPVSGFWGGIDGNWSDVIVYIGEPARAVRLQPYTSSQEIYVVDSTGCPVFDMQKFNDCDRERGNLYYRKNSRTWRTGPDDVYQLAVGEYLGIPTENTTGYQGNETFGFGYRPDNQTIALKDQQINAVSFYEFYLGVLPLSPAYILIDDYNNLLPPLLRRLKDEGQIPSLGWGLNIGAKYRNSAGVHTSLILGGYDASRFDTSKNLTMKMTDDDARDMVIGLSKIRSQDRSGEHQDYLVKGHFTFIDSTTPYIWLPTEDCVLFEQHLGIVWDQATELYLINDTTHQALLEKDPTFTFTFQRELPGYPDDPHVDITIPYKAFDLSIRRLPQITNSTRYFPLKRAKSDAQYVLGRSFMQELYLIADYERSEFVMAQALWNETSPSDIVTIRSATTNASTTATSSTPSMPSVTVGSTPNKRPQLSTGAITGIVVGSVLGAVAMYIIGLIVFRVLLARCKQRKSKENTKKVDSSSVEDNVADCEATPENQLDPVEDMLSEPRLDHSVHNHFLSENQNNSSQAGDFPLPHRLERSYTESVAVESFSLSRSGTMNVECSAMASRNALASVNEAIPPGQGETMRIG